MNITHIRESKNISRYALAKKAGISYKALVAIENDGDVKLSTLERIAEALQVSIVELIKNENPADSRERR